ncbi:MAG: hypothetical protein PSY14_06755 [bacterium]|nr:hypothetical protein [bacterium]
MAAVVAAIASTLVQKALSGGNKAEEQQKRLMAEQKAQQLRLQQGADKREAELNGKLAQSAAAVQARRRGRNSLSFTGPTGGLSSQLGG